ncbi:lipopolysaccharide kinase InaA family protein [Flavobacterium sp.]|uniref:lipopolysaccharide kinase InaA family protein n=1 Tax=Flavobacterium sp. TaxID=239 RepID=UPI003753CAF4
MPIFINNNYKSQENAIHQLVNNFFDDGEWIVKGSRNSIKSNFLNNENVNIKFFQKPGLLKSIIYSFFRATKAKRSFDYANYLIENNIKTPFPIAYIVEKNSFGLLGNSYYISQQIEYDFTIRELIHNPSFENRQSILEQFASFTFNMHEAKINFLDHSPGNTLIVKRDKINYDFYLIDLNRMKFENLSIQKRMDNFKKMWLSKTMVKIIANKYAELSEQNKSELQQILLLKTKQFKYKTYRKKFLKKKIGL